MWWTFLKVFAILTVVAIPMIVFYYFGAAVPKVAEVVTDWSASPASNKSAASPVFNQSVITAAMTTAAPGAKSLLQMFDRSSQNPDLLMPNAKPSSEDIKKLRDRERRQDNVSSASFGDANSSRAIAHRGIGETATAVIVGGIIQT